MNNNDLLLFVVVAVAFIAGYSIVSFIVRKLKTQEPTATCGEGKADQSQQKESEGKDGDSTGSNANQGEEKKEQHKWWEREQESGRGETWKSQTEEQTYGKVLGLKGEFDVADVKRAYRELIVKYHPDKIDYLGDEFKEIAETRTREINEAYDFFRKKYNIR